VHKNRGLRTEAGFCHGCFLCFQGFAIPEEPARPGGPSRSGSARAGDGGAEARQCGDRGHHVVHQHLQPSVMLSAGLVARTQPRRGSR